MIIISALPEFANFSIAFRIALNATETRNHMSQFKTISVIVLTSITSLLTGISQLFTLGDLSHAILTVTAVYMVRPFSTDHFS